MRATVVDRRYNCIVLRTRFVDSSITSPRARSARATQRRAAGRATVIDRRYRLHWFADVVCGQGYHRAPRPEVAGYPKARGGAGDGRRPPLQLRCFAGAVF